MNSIPMNYIIDYLKKDNKQIEMIVLIKFIDKNVIDYYFPNSEKILEYAKDNNNDVLTASVISMLHNSNIDFTIIEKNKGSIYSMKIPNTDSKLHKIILNIGKSDDYTAFMINFQIK